MRLSNCRRCLTCQLKSCRLSILLQTYPTLLVHVQKIESNHEQLAKIGERTDEIKDLHTRHELTVKRNREVQPDIQYWLPQGLSPSV